MSSEMPLVEITDLRKEFPVKQNFFEVLAKKPQRSVKAVDGVSMTIHRGECMGLVGESGCGKSTLVKTLIRLYEPNGGKICLDGQDITHISRRQMRQQARNIQMIFQDPYSSLNPRMSVRAILREALLYHHMCSPEQVNDRILELMSLVGLQEQQADRYPGEFSGGQRQRIGIARALALEPKLIIADEPVSALDVSIQAQVINLLIDLRAKLGLTLLFISHDLRVVRYITDRVCVMYLGSLVEQAATEELYEHPLHPYTQILLKASPSITHREEDKEDLIQGDLPSPMDLPSGCRFHPRCPMATEQCRRESPQLREVTPGHWAACHHCLEGGRQI